MSRAEKDLKKIQKYLFNSCMNLKEMDDEDMKAYLQSKFSLKYIDEYKLMQVIEEYRKEIIECDLKRTKKYLAENCGYLGQVSQDVLGSYLRKKGILRYTYGSNVIIPYLQKADEDFVMQLSIQLKELFERTDMKNSYDIFFEYEDIFKMTHSNTKNCFEKTIQILENDGYIDELQLQVGEKTGQSKYSTADFEKLKAIPWKVLKSKRVEMQDSEEFSLDDI